MITGCSLSSSGKAFDAEVAHFHDQILGGRIGIVGQEHKWDPLLMEDIDQFRRPWDKLILAVDDTIHVE